MLSRSRDEAIVVLKDNGPKSILICASGLSLKSFAWIRWLSGEFFGYTVAITYYLFSRVFFLMHDVPIPFPIESRLTFYYFFAIILSS